MKNLKKFVAIMAAAAMLSLIHIQMCIRDSVYTVDKFKKTAQEFLDENSGLKYAVVDVYFADFKYINDVLSLIHIQMCIRDRARSKYGAKRPKDAK